MDRRKFVGTVAGGLLVAPLTARTQLALPVIGFLCSGSPEQWTRNVAGFQQGLNEAGLVEGKNVTIEYRWSEGDYERLPALATDLVSRHVSVLVAVGGGVAAMAAKSATSTIPIVFTLGNDPVQLGLVASLSRPGGNATGVSIVTSELMAKRLELVHELVPKANIIVALMNPGSPDMEAQVRRMQEAARLLGFQLHVLRARTEQDIDTAFAAIIQLRAHALLVASDAFFNSRRQQLVGLAARYAVPAIFDLRAFVVSGGLMSFGADLPEAYRQAGIYAGKILNGAKPGDLPVRQPTKFELVINLKTAKALGITIPQSLLVLADQVIE